ncbi:hypothetical protein [Dyella dinghuensis]|nr:hypothetical protein [Dyella dinghuensis]
MERLRGARRRLAVDARRWGGDETVASVRRQRAGTDKTAWRGRRWTS